jgi:YHS domain-containing protein
MDRFSLDDGRISFGRRPDVTKVIDPVCGMEIDPLHAAGHIDWGGQRYYFCSQVCEASFRADPQKHAASAPQT